MNYLNLSEEALKNAIRQDFFNDYFCTVLGKIDFVVVLPEGTPEYSSVLWAEAKRGKNHDIYESFVQLILTIGNQKDKGYMPPSYIGAFDGEKFAFIEYYDIHEVFGRNDFNWNVAPSNHDTKEFKQLYNLCKKTLEDKKILYRYESDSKELRKFIKKLEKGGGGKVNVTKNNFPNVFQKWLATVKDSISTDWDKMQEIGVLPADFFLADLLSSDNESLKDNLSVVLEKTKYKVAHKFNGMAAYIPADFKDDQKAHQEFWAKYERPPKTEYWSYIIDRRDLLVPQDIRERKGSFFTPQIWVEKSQEYLAAVLGENWQDEYYIWDCCAGTGNLLNGLTNYRNVWASTLDKADVDVMIDRVNNGWNMFENHIFQFDFLNDNFDKLPEELSEIINDENKRKKLVIYINPPYAEADNRKGAGRKGVAENTTHDKYASILKKAQRELFALFFTRIYHEIQGCILGEFSTLKILQAANFRDFRNDFKATIKKSFFVPGNTFDNVKGDFPIGFFVWNLTEQRVFAETISDIYDENGTFLGEKKILSYDQSVLLNKWIDEFKPMKNVENSIATMIGVASDFQNQRLTRIELPYMKVPADNHNWQIISSNLIPSAIYLAVRWCMDSTWLNDRDQFLYPNDGWKKDFEFQSNCLIYTLFHGQNHISAEHGVNNWIPFTEGEVGCKNAFKSRFMSDFIAGKIKRTDAPSTQEIQSGFEALKPVTETSKFEKVVFTEESQDVYNAGLNLWKYYHKQKNANPDASFYDIRKHFQGMNEKGNMNPNSEDERYTALIKNLRGKMKILADKIAEKVYEYGFLK